MVNFKPTTNRFVHTIINNNNLMLCERTWAKAQYLNFPLMWYNNKKTIFFFYTLVSFQDAWNIG